MARQPAPDALSPPALLHLQFPQLTLAGLPRPCPAAPEAGYALAVPQLSALVESGEPCAPRPQRTPERQAGLAVVTLLVPEIGLVLVAGQLMTGGALASGLIGALVKLGHSRVQAESLVEQLQSGRYPVVVHTEETQRAETCSETQGRPQGTFVGAAPLGRFAGHHLSDHRSSAEGADPGGLTTLFSSGSKIPLHRIMGRSTADCLRSRSKATKVWTWLPPCTRPPSTRAARGWK